MKVVGVIPARLKSERLKNKVLKLIAGKPLLWYVWKQAKEAKLLDKVIIACCDEEVKEAARNFGADVFWTNPELKSGTDRVADAASKINCEIVLNIQGDEPLIRPESLDEIAGFLIHNINYHMASVAFSTMQKEELENPNVVKVVTDKNGNALYFSRGMIPCGVRSDVKVKYLKHIGIYGYRKNFLLEFSSLEQTPLEKIEKLEQLRAIENGIDIKIIEIDYDTVGVDTEEDFIKAQKELLQNTKSV